MVSEKWSTEQLLRLPRTFCCYAPPPQTPPIGPLPATKNRRVTFGAFNTLAKTTPAMIELWRRILHELPDARLLVLSRTFTEASVREGLLQQFAQHGVTADRLELLATVSLDEYLELFNRIDIALDTFPFNGHTTTCHALWMGAAVVSLAGETPVSRVGASLLRHVALAHLATTTGDAYVAAAVELAQRVGPLGAIRKDLRRRMQKSPLMNAPAFAKDLGAAYRQVWTRWCHQARNAT